MDGAVQIARLVHAGADILQLNFITQPRMIGRNFPGDIAALAARADFKGRATLRIQKRKTACGRQRRQVRKRGRFGGPGQVAENLRAFRCLPQHTKAWVDPGPIAAAGVIAIPQKTILTFARGLAAGCPGNQRNPRHNFQAVFQIGIEILGAINGIGCHDRASISADIIEASGTNTA